MAFPPNPISANKAPGIPDTPSEHPDHHNALANAVNDIVTELTTTGYVKVAGDVFTGDITISKNAPRLKLNRASGQSQSGQIYFTNNDILRWQLKGGDAQPGDFYFIHYDVAGVQDYTPLTLNNDGSISMSGATSVSVPNATADSHALNRITADGRYLNVSGDTITGHITVQNGIDIKFTDKTGTYPSATGGFMWDLNNDTAKIYAQQPSSDNIDFVFKLQDNALTTERWIFWVDDYQGASYDRWPIIARGDGGVFLGLPNDGAGNPVLTQASFEVTGPAGSQNYANKPIYLRTPALPTANEHVTNKSYVDTADALKLNLTGGTLTGNLSISNGGYLNVSGSGTYPIRTYSTVDNIWIQSTDGYNGWVGQRQTDSSRRFAFESNPSIASGSNFALYVYDAVGGNAATMWRAEHATPSHTTFYSALRANIAPSAATDVARKTELDTKASLTGATFTGQVNVRTTNAVLTVGGDTSTKLNFTNSSGSTVRHQLYTGSGGSLTFYRGDGTQALIVLNSLGDISMTAATSVSVPTPTSNAHAATKLYVDTEIANNPGGSDGFSFVAESATPPSATTTGQTWYDSTTGLSYVWYDSYWVQFAPGDSSGGGLIDGRARHKLSSGIAYPGANANIQYNATDFNTGPMPTLSSGVFTVVQNGLYHIQAEVNWGASSSPNVVASWINVTNTNGTLRYDSAQAWPTTVSGESGWTTNSVAVVKLVEGDTFSVQVYTASGSPAGLSASVINIVLIDDGSGGGGPVVTPWTSLTGSNGWTSTLKYRKIGDVVYLRGALSGNGTNDVAAATLPVGFRPSATNVWIVGTDGGSLTPRVCGLEIQADGDIVPTAYYGDGGYTTVYVGDLQFSVSI